MIFIAIVRLPHYIFYLAPAYGAWGFVSGHCRYLRLNAFYFRVYIGQYPYHEKKKRNYGSTGGSYRAIYDARHLPDGDIVSRLTTWFVEYSTNVSGEGGSRPLEEKAPEEQDHCTRLEGVTS
jgi:hypothetical protein